MNTSNVKEILNIANQISYTAIETTEDSIILFISLDTYLANLLSITSKLNELVASSYNVLIDTFIRFDEDYIIVTIKL